jgi:CO/xanthine dehydrogenase Mo-binding subunit
MTAPRTLPVGSSVVRTDGRAKVTGQTRYTDDLAFHGLYGATVRAPVARGRIKSIRFGDGPDWREFVIVTARDIPRISRNIHAPDTSHGTTDEQDSGLRDQNTVKLIAEDQPYLVRDEIRHKHEAVVLIAHPDKDIVRWAATKVVIEVEELPSVLDYRVEPEPGQIQYGADNVFKRYDLKKGAGEDAATLADIFANAACVVEGVYESGAQEQAYIEPQGMIAEVITDDASGKLWPDKPFRVRIEGSMQCPYYVHTAMKHLLNLPDDAVQIVQAATGGGFGGKEDYPSVIAGHAVLLALKSRQPVKIIYDRVEDMQSTTKRHPCHTRLRTALDADGKLLALQADVRMDGGAYVTLSPVVLSRGTIHIGGPYEIPHVAVTSRCMLSNTAPNGAFRGFGAPQTIYAMERHLDVCAEQIGLDPAELRRRNLVRRGGTLATGQVIEEAIDLTGWMDEALAVIDYAQKRKDHETFNAEQEQRGLPLRRGVGLATFMHGCGFTGSGEVNLASIVDVRASADGKVEVLTANTEIGQGAETIFAQVAAQAMGLELADIRVVQPDTAVVPNSGPTVASRTSMVVGHLVARACDDLVHQLETAGLLAHAQQNAAGERVSVQSEGRGQRWQPGDLRTALTKAAERGGVASRGRAQYEPPPGVIWDDETYKGVAYGTYAWACYVADVELDTTTFEVKVRDFVALQEVGKVLHPVLATGQIVGGVVQALGWALLEEVVLDKQGGMANANLTTYVLPTMADVPPIRVLFKEQPYSYGPFGAKGIGELPMDGPAPAVANAVSMALGRQVQHIPCTPERLLAVAMAAQPARA